MATQAERLEALEKDNGILSAAVEALTSTVSGLAERLSDVERLLKDGETLDELRSLVAKAAPLSDFETLTERVEKLELDGVPGGGELIAAELVEGYDPRGEVLKAFRQIEAIANHINVRLPA